MPTYDYECQACQHGFERYQEMSAKKLRKCPACGKPKLLRLVGKGAGVIFKGSGFYETDYKRAASNNGKKAESSKTTKTETASTSSKSDSSSKVKSDSSSSTSSSSKKSDGKSTKS